MRRLQLAVAVVAAIAGVLGARGVLGSLGGDARPSSFAEATEYTRQPVRFAPRRILRVRTAKGLRRAIGNLRPGDEVVATRPFTVHRELVITKRVAAPGALLRLGTGAKAVRLSFDGTGSFPAVWLHGARGLVLLGGDVSSPRGGNGIELSGGTNHVTWWGFRIHDVGASGLAALPAGGAIDHVDLEGAVTRWGLNPARDPHSEKRTGVHAAILADVVGAVFDDNRIAIKASDGPGDAIELGNPTPAGEIERDTLILSARNLQYAATRAVAGNGLQLWGQVPIRATVPYLVTRDTQGRAVDANGVFPGVSMHQVHVLYGRAFVCCLNPRLPRTEPAVARGEAWDPRFDVDYGNVKTER